MLHNTMTNNLLTLFCLVDGEATSNAFSTKVPSSDTVDDLVSFSVWDRPSSVQFHVESEISISLATVRALQWLFGSRI
jgi:hypothetical protein